MERYWQKNKPVLHGVLLGLVVYVFQVLLVSGLAVEVMVILSLLVAIAIVILRTTDPISVQRNTNRR